MCQTLDNLFDGSHLRASDTVALACCDGLAGFAGGGGGSTRLIGYAITMSWMIATTKQEGKGHFMQDLRR